MVPEVTEVILNSFRQFIVYFLTTAIWLILNALYKVKPLLNWVLIVAKIWRLHAEDHLNERIHEYREESNAENLNYWTHNFLSQWTRVIIAIAYSWQGSQRVVHAYNEALVNFVEFRFYFKSHFTYTKQPSTNHSFFIFLADFVWKIIWKQRFQLIVELLVAFINKKIMTLSSKFETYDKICILGIV